jgi:D-alanine--poly(phosphoribitol) ligase subunit 2
MIESELVAIQERVVEILRQINSKQYIVDEILDVDLFESQILDSFLVLELITNLESLFSIQIPVQDLNLENLSTVSSIGRYLVSRL